jgi:hypothetical protein
MSNLMEDVQRCPDCMKADTLCDYHQRVLRIVSTVEKMRKVLEMVVDNTKMPHQHEDLQLRLYCLAERAREVLESN